MCCVSIVVGKCGNPWVIHTYIYVYTRARRKRRRNYKIISGSVACTSGNAFLQDTRNTRIHMHSRRVISRCLVSISSSSVPGTRVHMYTRQGILRECTESFTPPLTIHHHHISHYRAFYGGNIGRVYKCIQTHARLCVIASHLFANTSLPSHVYGGYLSFSPRAYVRYLCKCNSGGGGRGKFGWCKFVVKERLSLVERKNRVNMGRGRWNTRVSWLRLCWISLAEPNASESAA